MCTRECACGVRIAKWGWCGVGETCALPALVAVNNPFSNAANPEHRAANSTSAAAIGSLLALASRMEIEAPRMSPHCALARDALLPGARIAVGTLLVVGGGLAEKILLLSTRRLRAQSRRLRLGRLPDRRRLGGVPRQRNRPSSYEQLYIIPNHGRYGFLLGAHPRAQRNRAEGALQVWTYCSRHFIRRHAAILQAFVQRE